MATGALDLEHPFLKMQGPEYTRTSQTSTLRKACDIAKRLGTHTFLRLASSSIHDALTVW